MLLRGVEKQIMDLLTEKDASTPWTIKGHQREVDIVSVLSNNPAMWAELAETNPMRAADFLMSLDSRGMKNFLTNAYNSGIPVVSIFVDLITPFYNNYNPNLRGGYMDQLRQKIAPRYALLPTQQRRGLYGFYSKVTGEGVGYTKDSKYASIDDREIEGAHSIEHKNSVKLMEFLRGNLLPAIKENNLSAKFDQVELARRGTDTLKKNPPSHPLFTMTLDVKNLDDTKEFEVFKDILENLSIESILKELNLVTVAGIAGTTTVFERLVETLPYSHRVLHYIFERMANDKKPAAVLSWKQNVDKKVTQRLQTYYPTLYADYAMMRTALYDSEDLYGYLEDAPEKRNKPNQFLISEVIYTSDRLIWGSVIDDLIAHPNKMIKLMKESIKTANLYLNAMKDPQILQMFQKNAALKEPPLQGADQPVALPVAQQQEGGEFLLIEILTLELTNKPNEKVSTLNLQAITRLINILPEDILAKTLMNANQDLCGKLFTTEVDVMQENNNYYYYYKKTDPLINKIYNKLSPANRLNFLLHLQSYPDLLEQFAIDNYIAALTLDQALSIRLVTEFVNPPVLNWLLNKKNVHAFMKIFNNLPEDMQGQIVSKFTLETFQQLINYFTNSPKVVDTFLMQALGLNPAENLQSNFDFFKVIFQAICSKPELFDVAQKLYLISPETFKQDNDSYRAYVNSINITISRTKLNGISNTINPASLAPMIEQWILAPSSFIAFINGLEMNKHHIAIAYLNLFSGDQLNNFITNGIHGTAYQKEAIPNDFLENIIVLLEADIPDLFIEKINALPAEQALDFRPMAQGGTLYLPGLFEKLLKAQKYDLIFAIIKRQPPEMLQGVITQKFADHWTSHLSALPLDSAQNIIQLLQGYTLTASPELYAYSLNRILTVLLSRLPESMDLMNFLLRNNSQYNDLRAFYNQVSSTVWELANQHEFSGEKFRNVITLITAITTDQPNAIVNLMPKIKADVDPPAYINILQKLLDVEAVNLAITLYNQWPAFFNAPENQNVFKETIAFMIAQTMVNRYIPPVQVATAPPAPYHVPGFNYATINVQMPIAPPPQFSPASAPPSTTPAPGNTHMLPGYEDTEEQAQIPQAPPAYSEKTHSSEASETSSETSNVSNSPTSSKLIFSASQSSSDKPTYEELKQQLEAMINANQLLINLVNHMGEQVQGYKAKAETKNKKG